MAELTSNFAFPPQLDQIQLESLRTSLIDWCLSHGLVVRPPANLSDNPNTCLVSHAPVALFPSLFSRKAFDQAKHIQTAYNELYAKIALDEQFLSKIMRELSDVDGFINGLWEVHRRVSSEGIAQVYDHTNGTVTKF